MSSCVFAKCAWQTPRLRFARGLPTCLSLQSDDGQCWRARLRSSPKAYCGSAYAFAISGEIERRLFDAEMSESAKTEIIILTNSQSQIIYFFGRPKFLPMIALADQRSSSNCAFDVRNDRQIQLFVKIHVYWLARCCRLRPWLPIC